jgi:hypothetical protein
MDDPLSGALKILSSFARDYLLELEPFYRNWNAEKILKEEKVRRQLGCGLLLRVVGAACRELLSERGFEGVVLQTFQTSIQLAPQKVAI